jgi:ubiquinol-cytochrome c reductase cytochrome b subunit
MFKKLLRWIDERWPLTPLINLSLEEEMPGGASFSYVFGSATLIVFLLQVVSGIWQLFYYVPTLDHAYNSLMYLRLQIPFGWLAHGLHYWGANAMVVLVLVHMSRVFIWGAYKRPHELQWITGVFLLLTTFVLTLTGGALPWDKRSYWLVEIATSTAGTLPWLGSFIKGVMLGGDRIGQLTISRFFITHAAILPAVLLGLFAVHIVGLRKVGSAGNWSRDKNRIEGPFWPDQVFKDGLFSVIVFMVLVTLTVWFRPPISGMADPLDTFYTPKPEWNFLFFYQVLKYFPGRLELLPAFGIPIGGTVFLLLIPFLDRREERSPLKRPVAMIGFAVVAAAFVVFTILGAVETPGKGAKRTTGESASQEQAPQAAAPSGKGGASPAAPQKAGAPAQSTQASSPTGPSSAQSPSAAGVAKGRELFDTQGCTACHRVDGKGGSVGPDLSNEGDKGRSRSWIIAQIRNSKSHFPGSIMPSFSQLSDLQVGHLADFLLSRKKGRAAAPTGGKPKATPAAPAKAQKKAAPSSGTSEKASCPPAAGSGPTASSIIGSAGHGAVIFPQICASCHGPQGTDKVPNPGSDDGTVPPLNPIDPELANKDPQAFVDKINPLLQHGSVPSGPHPAIKMPAWGDSGTLTQQQIADLEAYVLSLNGVDRARFEHPGVLPVTFFTLAVTVFAIVGLSLAGYWALIGRGGP